MDLDNPIQKVLFFTGLSKSNWYYKQLNKYADRRILVATLNFALRKWEINDNELIVRSDNGPQMTSNLFKDYLKTLEITVSHEFIPCATPNKDAHVEAFYSIIECEFLRAHSFNNFREAYELFYEFIKFYNEQRIHSSIGYRTPLEVINIYNNGGIINDVKKTNI